jgi:hypothetical protein
MNKSENLDCCKTASPQSVMYPGARKSVWELVQALRRSKRSGDRIMPDLWTAHRAEIAGKMGMER